MAETLKLPEFLDALRGSRFDGNPQPSFRVRAENDFFVDPTLQMKDSLGNLSADVVLLSARGAAGKTTTGQQISHELGAPLWKLEEDSAVSATALSFVLSRYMGTFEPERAIEAMTRPTILIDSLDEARARVSGTSWTQFLDSLSQFARRGARLILLGRERTLEEVWLTLDDAGIALAWLEISHFEHDERLSYVDGRTRRKAKSPAVVETEQYSQARDTILESLAGSLSGESADVFVGYAPVLDAVAAVLSREDNLFGITKAFDLSHGGTRGLEELRRILDRLLEREQTKVEPLAADLGIQPGLVYRPDEQIDWLCSGLLGGPTPGLLFLDEPQLRDKYIRGVSEFLQDHPFRSGDRWASAVFAAYVAYKRFESVPGAELLKVGNDSGLLFDFFSLDGSASVIGEEQFGALHASVTAGEFSGVSAAVETSERVGGEHEALIQLVRAGESFELRLTLLAGSPDELRLFGPLEAMTIVTDSGVSIPARQPATVLGPDLFIHCKSLTIEGSSVEFARRAVPAGGQNQSGQVILQVSGDLLLPNEIMREPLLGDFELLVPESTVLRYPWITYREKLEDETTADPNGRAERFLNMLMNLTRAHGHAGDRGCFVMKLQGRQSIKGEEFREVITSLTELGVVRLGGDILYLTPDYEKHRFSGKTQQGQRLIADVWDTWGPIVETIKSHIR